MPRIGQLRTRARLQRRTVGQDAEGGGTETWRTYATVWCQITPRAGSKPITHQSTAALTELVVWMRWRDDVHPLDRLVVRSRSDGADRVLTLIARMNVDSRNERLQMSATEVITPLPES